MDQRDVLSKLAKDKIVAESGRALDAVGEAAAKVLADLYAVGLQHGISPDDWAAVSALPGACWDASRARARQQQVTASRAPWIGDVRLVVPPAPVVPPYPGARSSYVTPPPSHGRRGPSR